MEENKRRRRISTPLLLFLILMGITLALCLTVLGIWLHEDSLHATAFAAVDGELLFIRGIYRSSASCTGAS